MKNLLRQDKRGVSVIIGYVILIVLALGMAGAVYSFIKFQIPKEPPKCKDSVQLIISELKCERDGDRSLVTVKLTNKGLFNVDGAYVKIGKVGEIPDEILNRDNIFFSELAGPTPGQQGLQPSETWSKTFNYTGAVYPNDVEREIQIQPVMFIENQVSLCQNAVVTEKVTCVEAPVVPDTTAPVISGDQFSPATVVSESGQGVTVSASVTDNIAVASLPQGVRINFRQIVQSGSPVVFDCGVTKNGNIYSCTTGGFVGATSYEIKIFALDTSNNPSEKVVGTVVVASASQSPPGNGGGKGTGGGL